MGTGNLIRVLVVDDSIVFREKLSRDISSAPDVEVVATARDPFDARDKIIRHNPDVMTCDIEMPRMDGIEFIKRLMPQHPLPVVVVSTISEAVFDALNAGAVDFVTKPDRSGIKYEDFSKELILKIRAASNAKVADIKKTIQTDTKKLKVKPSNIDIIAIGASTGGTQAVSGILKSLPASIPGIVIVQHMPPVFTRMFAERLDNSCVVNVKEARTGDCVERGRVLIAPGNYHMTVKRTDRKYMVKCYKGDKVNGFCPSVDVLFESVAKAAAKRSLGVILTGMGYDGAKGLMAMRRSGARTIGQDEASCVVYGMPRVAFSIGAVERQAPVESIAGLIYSISTSG